MLRQIRGGSTRRADDGAWDFIEPARFDQTIDVLRRSGYEPSLMLEDWEIEYQDISRVGVYGLADRARHGAGETVATSRIPHAR